MIDRIQGLESALGPQADEWKERAMEYAASAREMLAGGTDSIKDYAVKEPARALGVALGLGVLLGWLIKRR